MMVRPELINASSAPSARPLNTCETKLGQLIIDDRRNSLCRGTCVVELCGGPRHVGWCWKSGAAGSGLRRRVWSRSGVVAELAAERVRLLHQAFAGDDFHHVVIVFLALHLFFHLALHDDDRTDALMVFLAVVHVADKGWQRLFLFVGLDHVRRIEAARLLD